MDDFNPRKKKEKKKRSFRSAVSIMTKVLEVQELMRAYVRMKT